MFAASVLFPATGFADPLAGRDIAAQKCAPCHGVDGMALVEETPNLAGQNRGYLARQLLAYRAGQRRHEKMTPAVLALNDEEIADLAEWYSSITISATPPE